MHKYVDANLPVDTTLFNDACYIVGGGPSLKGFDWSRLDGKFVIAINRSYEVLPDAQIVYFTDHDFWETHHEAMLAHKAQLIKGILPESKEKTHPDVVYYTLTDACGVDDTPRCLRHGHNSSYAALNLAAVHLKFKKIYLLGVDMKWGERKNQSTSHWHDGHDRIDPETTYTTMIKSFKTMTAYLTNIGVIVYNVNLDSALDCFPKITREEANL